MKAQGAAVYGGLAAVGLLAAYFTWQRPKEDTSRGEVIVLDLSKKQLEKVRYEDKRRWVELVRAPEADETVLITEKQKATEPPKDPHAGLGIPAPASQPGATAETPPKTLRGSEQATKAFESLTPLRATRSLGKLDDKKLEELGLAKSDRALVVSSSKGERRFVVGQPPAGVGSAYLKAEDGTVYVVTASLLSDLEFASSRIVDRRLHDFKPEEAERISVTTDGKTRSFVQSNNKLAPEGQPDRTDDYARNWHERVTRLTPMELLGKGTVPPGGEPKVEVKVEYAAKGKPLGFIEIGRSGQDLYARTEHTAGWVKVHQSAEEVLNEAKKVAEAK